MKNIKVKNWIIILFSCCLALFLMSLAALELYTWKSHGYDKNYALKQKCIEVSPLSEEDKMLCDSLKDEN